MNTAMTRRSSQTPSTGPQDLFDLFTDRFFNRFLEPASTLANGETLRSWMPRTDIRETDEAFELYADLPGMTKQDIDLTFEDNVLTLAGERKFEDAGTDKGYRRIERSYGKFTRSFQVPKNIDATKILASFTDGVLTVTLPKAAEAQPRKVEIA